MVGTANYFATNNFNDLNQEASEEVVGNIHQEKVILDLPALQIKLLFS